jgi:hypothetical protein
MPRGRDPRAGTAHRGRADRPDPGVRFGYGVTALIRVAQLISGARVLPHVMSVW